MSKQGRWTKLDNAAKIFPPNASSKDTKVFRFTCQLTENIDKASLQSALEQTVADFPLYRSVLRKGVFWYYLEESGIKPLVFEESLPMCSPIYNPDKPGLLFRVMYYKKRIHLEVFHALTDGAGATLFMRVLVSHYLTEKYSLTERISDNDVSPEQKSEDAFYKYFDKTSAVSRERHRHAHRVRAELLPDSRIGAFEGYLSLKAVLDKAREYEATLSEFLIAHFICAIYEGMAVREKTKPVVISVPVDLRKFFSAKTASNFFAVVRISHQFSKDNQAFDDVLVSVRKSLRAQLTQENMSGIIKRYSSIESNFLIKAVPLLIKIPALAIAGLWSGQEETATFSNVGRITMPENASKHISLFNVFISTRRPQMCVCSSGGTLSVSLTSKLSDTGIERRFFRSLTSMGFEVDVVSNINQVYDEYGEEDELDAAV